MSFSGKNMRSILLQKRTLTINSFGEVVESWTNTPTYAQKYDKQGREVLESGANVAVADVRFKIRYVDGLNTTDYRIIEGTQIYDIENVQEQGRRQWQWLMTRKRSNTPDYEIMVMEDDTFFTFENGGYLVPE